MITVVLMVILLSLTDLTSAQFSMNSDIKFAIPQAQKIWEDPVILGDTTRFNHPLSIGTVTECEHEVMKTVFDDDFTFHHNYTDWSRSWTFNRVAHSLYQYGYSFRHSQPDLKIEGDILTKEGCFMACITLREFVCREFDFYKGDSGVCGLHKENGNYGDINNKKFVGTNPSSDHYKLYPFNEQPPACDLTEDGYAHPYFALGWKAFETGWYDLAHDQFRKALELDPEYYMAYIGLTLASPNMGFGLTEAQIGSYKQVISDISAKSDLALKLTYQQRLLLTALVAFHSGEDLEEGLEKMIAVFVEDEDTESSYVDKVIAGNSILMSLDSYGPLKRHSTNNIFALKYLTANLNPYKAGQKRRSADQAVAAVSAVYIYQSLEVDGAWQITSDCIDIAEYYAEWALGKSRVDSQRNFLFRNTGTNPELLFREEGSMLVANGLNVPYMSRSLRRINEYERLHFFELQMGQFELASSYLMAKTTEAEVDDDEERQDLRLRMAANAFFTTYDFIYDKYAQNMVFEADWSRPLTASTNELSLASRAYYWTAAAIQKIRSGSNDVSDILTSLNAAESSMGSDHFRNLLSIFKVIIKGTQQLLRNSYAEALESAKTAGDLNELLLDVDWTVANSEPSQEFRPLIPLGYQFRAEVIRKLHNNQDAVLLFPDQLSIAGVVAAYKDAVNAPPLNTSRLMEGYGYGLEGLFGRTPERSDEDTPAHVQVYNALLKAWESSDLEEFSVKKKAYDTVEFYYNREVHDCQADLFQIRTRNGLCWGGYVVIGVALALVVIIVIILGILCLRKKAGKPVKHKERVKPFSFSGPDLQSSFDDASSNESPPAYSSDGHELRRSFSINADDPLDRSHTHAPGVTYDYTGMYK